MVRVAARDRVVLQLAEMTGERDVFGADDILIPEKQHLVLQQERTDFRDQSRIA